MKDSVAPTIIFVSLFVAFLWGATPTIHKHVLNKLQPSTVMAVGGLFYFSCLVLFSFYYWKDISSDLRKNASMMSIFWIASVSIIAGFIANLIYLFVLRKNNSYVISALIYSAPIFTLILSYFLLKEKVSFLGLVGVLLIVGGIVCLAFNERGHKDEFVSFKE